MVKNDTLSYKIRLNVSCFVNKMPSLHLQITMLYGHIPTRMMRRSNEISPKFGMLQGRILNAEFSLQSASQNSRENNQRQSWSQIRKL